MLVKKLISALAMIERKNVAKIVCEPYCCQRRTRATVNFLLPYVLIALVPCTLDSGTADAARQLESAKHIAPLIWGRAGCLHLSGGSDFSGCDF